MGTLWVLLTNVYFSFPRTAQMSVLVYWVISGLKLTGGQISLLEVPPRPMRVQADITKPQEKDFSPSMTKGELHYFSQAYQEKSPHFIFDFVIFLSFTKFPYLLFILMKFQAVTE